MGNLSVWELIVILILVLVIFGGRRLPELGRGLGKGLANFRQAVREPDSAAKGSDGSAGGSEAGASAEAGEAKSDGQSVPPASGDGR